MLQFAKGQKPAVDLRMIEGRGFIKGLSGVDDRGQTFVEAKTHLRRLAEIKGEFSWTIELEITLGPTTTLRRLLELIEALDDIACDTDLRADISLVWRVARSDTSLWSEAKSVQAEIGKSKIPPAAKPGLKVIIEPI